MATYKVIGTNANETIYGKVGADNWLYGGNGNDGLVGGSPGSNHLYGGSGNDVNASLATGRLHLDRHGGIVPGLCGCGHGRDRAEYG